MSSTKSVRSVVDIFICDPVPVFELYNVVLLMNHVDIGCPETPRPIPISTCSRYDEANLISFVNRLSIILSDLGKTPDLVPEDALDVVKTEVIPYLCNHVPNFIIRGKFSISQDLLYHPKEPKVTWAHIW
jgi:hypothetical protein